MEENAVFTIVEPSEMIPVWYSRSIEGLRKTAAKQKYTVQLVTLQELEQKKGVNAAVVISTNDAWTQDIIENLRSRQIRPVLIGTVPQKFGEDVSGTLYSSTSSIKEMMNYFCACGRRNVALVGINRYSSNESVKVKAFLEASQSLNMPSTRNDIYYRDTEGQQTSEEFLDSIRNYDGAIGSNDYVAAYVLQYARDIGISVPEDLFVAGMGDMLLCRYTHPSLTSATRSYPKTGEQVFSIWKQLIRDPQIISIVTTVQCKIKTRGSTGFSPVPAPLGFYKTEKKPLTPSVLEKGSSAVQALENCLSQCDVLDIKLIQGTLSNISSEKLAEQLFVAVGTVRYRLKKIYKAANTDSKAEFIELFNRYISGTELFEDFVQGEYSVGDSN